MITEDQISGRKGGSVCGDQMKSRKGEGKIAKGTSFKITFDVSYRLAKCGF